MQGRDVESHLTIGACRHYTYVSDMFRQHPADEQGRPLTDRERALALGMFGCDLNLDPIRIYQRKWWLFQPRNVTMAPQGHIHFHPNGSSYCDCFGSSSIGLQAHLIHELVHIWQYQEGVNLILKRHPFCHYSYTIKPGWMLKRYGIEQQAEIVRHTFLLRHGVVVPGAPPLPTLESILPFKPA